MPVATTPRGVPIKRRPSSAPEQGFVMVLFQSFSAGAMAVLVAVLAILALVGIYAEVFWPYTMWSSANRGSLSSPQPLEYFLGFIFLCGSAAGFWCFSGAAFRKRTPQNKVSVTPRPAAQPTIRTDQRQKAIARSHSLR